LDEHSGQAEGNLLRVFLAPHCHLETVAKIDVHDFATQAVQHQVGGMPVAKPKDVANLLERRTIILLIHS
jgi:hypothetical protein